jgi:hypothetical protein
VTGPWEDTPPDDEPSRLDRLRGHLFRGADLAKIPPPRVLIEGWLDWDSLAWIIGQSGHGKSFVALDAAGCVANGIDWHGNVTKQAPVLYVILEGAPGLHQRVRAWEDHYGTEMGVTFMVIRKFHIMTDAEPLGELAHELDAGLVVIDTQNRATVGLDENSGVDMGHMIARLETVREASGACVATVHHTAIEGRRPRGHGSIDGAASTVIRVARDGAVVKIENGKQKEHARQSSLVLAAQERAGGLILASDGVAEAVADSEVKVLAALRTLVAIKGNVTYTDLKQSVTGAGMPKSTYDWALRRLVERGLVIRKGSSYMLADPTQGTLS